MTINTETMFDMFDIIRRFRRQDNFLLITDFSILVQQFAFRSAVTAGLPPVKKNRKK